ncbi:hypothetical protein L1887_47811 [Cichorium endivia]|nr:hypothetical protein L1887_47811 [Cichorium endivia]
MQALAATQCGAVSCAISRILSAAFCILHLGKDVDRSRMDAASELAWEASLVRLNCLFNAHRSEQTGISCEFYSGFAAFTGPMCSRQRSPQFCLGRPKLLSGSAAGVRASAPHAPWHGSDAHLTGQAGNSVTAFF